MNPGEDPDDVCARVRQVYEHISPQWERARRDLREERWLRRVFDPLPAGARVLDFGCGTGVPIGAWLVAQGYSVHGVDFSPRQIETARALVPQASYEVCDLRAFVSEERFAGAVVWDSMFHIPPSAQAGVIDRVSAVMTPGAKVLLGVGAGDGEFWAPMMGCMVYYAGLGVDGISRMLRDGGFRVDFAEIDDPNDDGHLVVGATYIGSE